MVPEYRIELWQWGERADVAEIDIDALPKEVALELATRLYGDDVVTTSRYNAQSGVQSCLVHDGDDIHASIYVEATAQDRSSNVDVGL